MDDKLFRRALLAAALGLGVWTGLARADGPAMPLPVGAQAPSVIVINGMIYTNTGVPAAAPAVTVPVVATTPAAAATPAAPAAPTCSTCTGNAAVAVDVKDEKTHSLRSMWEAHPVATFWHDHKPVGCWTHFNNLTCSTWESEYAFIFGSCRNFFGEACMGKPEPAFPGEQPPKNICPNCARP